MLVAHERLRQSLPLQAPNGQTFAPYERHHLFASLDTDSRSPAAYLFGLAFFSIFFHFLPLLDARGRAPIHLNLLFQVVAARGALS